MNCNSEGFAVNHKRVLRMMREDKLLCVRRRAFVVTTDSRHSLPVYPNLAREMRPTALHQLWLADKTYIRLRSEFSRCSWTPSRGAWLASYIIDDVGCRQRIIVWEVIGARTDGVVGHLGWI
jgi:transposase InsO family protein